MASTRDIKRRIKSVKNIAQITKAMEAVAANKMRKSQEFALVARPYAVASLELLHNLLSRTPNVPVLLRAREVKKSALLVVTSDKGLAGAYSSNVIRMADKWVTEKKKAGAQFTLIVVGKKARDYFSHRNIPIHETFSGFGDFSELEETKAVTDLIVNGYLVGSWDEVHAIYTHFRTTLNQEVLSRQVLPATESGIAEMVQGILPEAGRYSKTHDKKTVSPAIEYKFEPSVQEIINTLVPRIIAMHVHHIILEANASEHSSRMVAMKNASDNAKDLIQDLSLVYNKVRQAGITREIIEITAGKQALE